MLKGILGIATLAILSSTFTSCEKEDPVITNEEELITTVHYTLTPQSGGSDIVLSYQDLDGDGGESPIIEGGILTQGETYMGSIQILNELVQPTENINEEISEEATDHQFFFISDLLGLSVVYEDFDANGFPLGLLTTIKPDSTSTGELTLILRHQPNKQGANVAQGDITNAGGETDIEISFPIEVQ